MSSTAYIFIAFAAAAWLVMMGIYVLTMIVGWEVIIVVTTGALLFGAGAAIIEYMTTERS